MNIDPLPKVEKTNELIVFDSSLNENINIVEVANNVKDTVTSQDFNQRMNVILSVVLEFYRVITCSLLIVFVPQKCGTQLCTVSQNLSWEYDFYNVALVFNFVTLASFCPLYYIEIVRENQLIKYLHVNPDKPNEDKMVEQTLMILPIDKNQKIVDIDKQYQTLAYIVMTVYFINTIFSGIIVFEYYLGQQTATAFITYILLILTKLMNVYAIANTPKHTFYSAYLKSNVQYNDVDKDYKKELLLEYENELESKQQSELELTKNQA